MNIRQFRDNTSAEEPTIFCGIAALLRKPTIQSSMELRTEVKKEPEAGGIHGHQARIEDGKDHRSRARTYSNAHGIRRRSRLLYADHGAAHGRGLAPCCGTIPGRWAVHRRSAYPCRAPCADSPWHEVTIHSELVKVEDRRLTFAVEAWDEVEKIGQGTHVRVIIDLQRFAQKIARKEAKAAQISSASDVQGGSR